MGLASDTPDRLLVKVLTEDKVNSTLLIFHQWFRLNSNIVTLVQQAQHSQITAICTYLSSRSSATGLQNSNHRCHLMFTLTIKFLNVSLHYQDWLVCLYVQCRRNRSESEIIYEIYSHVCSSRENNFHFVTNFTSRNYHIRSSPYFCTVWLYAMTCTYRCCRAERPYSQPLETSVMLLLSKYLKKKKIQHIIHLHGIQCINNKKHELSGMYITISYDVS